MSTKDLIALAQQRYDNREHGRQQDSAADSDELLRRADLIIAHLLTVRDGGAPNHAAEEDIVGWILDSRAAICRAVDALNREAP